MRVMQLPHGTRGFDCNNTVSYDSARKLMDAGFRFAVRYAPRVKAHPGDLSAAEVQDLLRAGLALMVVQHVEAETGHGWQVSESKGKSYGAMAAAHAKACGVPLGTCVWLDLEDVDPHTEHEDIITYCNTWYIEVASVGFTPGVYVGWNAVLTPMELYHRLKFEHYWGAYNLNRDQEPYHRGLQMRQGREIQVPGVPFRIDPDVVMRDGLGGLPLACAPDEWVGIL